MDDSTYRNDALQRIEEYEREGYYIGENLIVTAETGKKPLSRLQVKRIAEHFLL